MDRAGVDRSRGVRRVPRHDHRVRLVPGDQQDVRLVVAGDLVVGAQRVHVGLRRDAHPLRTSRRPRRPPADVPHRRRRVHRRLDAVRAVAHGRHPDRCGDGRGGRRGDPGAGLAGPGAADLPAREARRGRRHLGRHRRRRRRVRPDDRRAGRLQPLLAVGVLHQPARRHLQLRARPHRAPRGQGGQPRPDPRPGERRRARRRDRPRRLRGGRDAVDRVGERPVLRRAGHRAGAARACSSTAAAGCPTR